MVYSTTWKYKDLHSIQRVKSVKIHVSGSTARLEVVIEKTKALTFSLMKNTCPSEGQVVLFSFLV